MCVCYMNSESMNLEEAQQWAFSNLNLNEEDWPEEKWLELSGSTGTVNREDIVKLFEELGIPGNNNDENIDEELEPNNMNGDDDEEIFAADGNMDSPTNDDDFLGKGTFNEDENDDDLDLGGMMIPDLAVVAGNNGGGKGGGGGGSDLTAWEGGGDEEIFAADGEAFEGSEGPGRFDDDEDEGGISGNGLQITGSPAK
jgi:hypothetical protein